MYTIYIIDRANQFHVEHHATQEQADDASDRWEAEGHDVYSDRMRALLAMDRYARRMMRTGHLIHITVGA